MTAHSYANAASAVNELCNDSNAGVASYYAPSRGCQPTLITCGGGLGEEGGGRKLKTASKLSCKREGQVQFAFQWGVKFEIAERQVIFSYRSELVLDSICSG